MMVMVNHFTKESGPSEFIFEVFRLFVDVAGVNFFFDPIGRIWNKTGSIIEWKTSKLFKVTTMNYCYSLWTNFSPFNTWSHMCYK